MLLNQIRLPSRPTGPAALASTIAAGTHPREGVRPEPVPEVERPAGRDRVGEDVVAHGVVLTPIDRDAVGEVRELRGWGCSALRLVLGWSTRSARVVLG